MEEADVWSKKPGLEESWVWSGAGFREWVRMMIEVACN